jgi:hypothetical protein
MTGVADPQNMPVAGRRSLLLFVCRSKPDAAALALCIDANHAPKIAKLLEDITGESPDIIVSDTELSTSSVDDFRDSKRKWIVAVRMVSYQRA